MNKLAIFVEGQTEQAFARKLLEEIAGTKNILIEEREARGGRKVKRRMRRLEATAVDSGQKYFVMIVDCGADERVKSDIAERYDGLVKSGYQGIVGIRDVYPQKREDIPKLRRLLRYKVRSVPVEVLFVLAVMEIEAWFIAEHTHFERIHDELTTGRIHAEMGFDPAVDDVHLRDHPAEDLHKIYRSVGLAYQKTKAHVERTVDLLDYARVYLDLGQRFGDLQNLTDHIDRFLSGDQAT